MFYSHAEENLKQTTLGKTKLNLQAVVRYTFLISHLFVVAVRTVIEGVLFLEGGDKN